KLRAQIRRDRRVRFYSRPNLSCFVQTASVIERAPTTTHDEVVSKTAAGHITRLRARLISQVRTEILACKKQAHTTFCSYFTNLLIQFKSRLCSRRILRP